jgi:hypothetical protein
MKRLFLGLLSVIVGVTLLYPQSSARRQSEIDKKIQQAPEKIRKHYVTLDSLLDLGQHRWVNETWSDDEVKRYAGILYDTYEHDPILRKQHEFDPERLKQYENKGWLIGDRTVFKEISKRMSSCDVRLITVSYWLTVRIDSVVTRALENSPGENIQFTEKRVHGTITTVWKGLQYKEGQRIECYYLKEWGNPGIDVGKEYLLLLDPVMDYERQRYDKISIGGPSFVREYVFPIDSGFINDRTKLFGLGERVDLKTFSKFLTAEIAKIKSWKWSAAK